jgi:hypothetical protein
MGGKAITLGIRLGRATGSWLRGSGLVKLEGRSATLLLTTRYQWRSCECPRRVRALEKQGGGTTESVCCPPPVQDDPLRAVGPFDTP